MAFARSASGPSGLTINTGAANTLSTPSLFGSSTTQAANPTTTAAASGGLFGAAPTTTAATTQSTGASAFGSAFGAAATTSQPQQSSSLFGAKPAATTTNPQQSSAFGASTLGTQAATPAAGGLFGSSTAAAPQQQQQSTLGGAGGGLFGASTANKPAQSTTGGLFGSTMAQPQQQSQQQQQQQQQTAGGLLGSKPAGSLLGASTTGFGQSTAQNAPRPSGLFASTSQQPQLGMGMGKGNSSLPSGLTLGQSTTNPGSTNAQVIPGVRIDVTNLRGTTRFNDLQEDLQKQIAMIDAGIQLAINQNNELDAFMPAHGDQIEAIPTDVTFVARKYAGVDSALAGDANAVNVVRGLVNEDAENAKLSFRATDNLKLPAQYHTSGLWRMGGSNGSGGDNGAADAEAQQDLVGFFSREAKEMEMKLEKHRGHLREIEGHMHGVHAGIVERIQRIVAKNGGTGVGGGGAGAGAGADGKGGQDGDKLAELAGVLSEFEEKILQLAGTVGTAREGLSRLQLGEFMGRGGGGM